MLLNGGGGAAPVICLGATVLTCCCWAAAANSGEAAARAAASWSEVMNPAEEGGKTPGLEPEADEVEGPDVGKVCSLPRVGRGWFWPRSPVTPPKREPCWAEANAAASYKVQF